MYRIFLILFLLFSGLWAHAIELEKTFLDAEFNPTSSAKEATYYRTVAPAEPLYYAEVHFITNEMKMKGYYLDSTLTTLQGECSYYFKNGQLESKGLYDKGKKVGFWQRFNSDGLRKPDRYYFTVQELASQTNNRNALAQFRTNEQTWNQFVQNNLEFPEKAALLGFEEAEVNVNLIINSKGQLSHFEILSCPHKSFFVETIKLMAEMPDWNPAMKSGKCISSNYIVKVLFNSSTLKEKK